MKVSSAKKQLKIVVVGRSGAGKSTFINMIANLIKGKKYEDERIVAISQGLTFKAKEGEDDVKITFQCNVPEFMHLQSDNLSAGQHESQTQRCSMYTFSSEDFDLMLIDTPGLGDTRGVDQDKLNVVMISEQVARLGTFNAIILLHRASDVRADSTVSYLINELRAIMSKECQNNIIVAFSNVTNPLRVDARDSLKELGLSLDKEVLFECDCLLPASMVRPYFKDERRFNTYKKKSINFWDMNTESFNELIAMLKTMLPVDAETIEIIRKKKLLLTERVSNTMDQIRAIVAKKVEIKIKADKIRDHSRTIDHECVGMETIISEKVIENTRTVTKTDTVWVDSPSYWIVQCSVCHGLCEKYPLKKYSKKEMDEFMRKHAKGCCRERDIKCNHSLSQHTVQKEGYYKKVSYQVKDGADTIVEVKEINLSAKGRVEKLMQEKKRLENELDEVASLVKCLEAEVTKMLKQNANDIKAIQAGSLAEVSDACLVRLDMEIIKAQERADKASPTAPLEIEMLHEVKEQYTQLQQKSAPTDLSQIQVPTMVGDKPPSQSGSSRG
jgi:GTPase SAR1 family protein